ncbi:hypothetical protein IFM89_039609 [Coptis chinensis]|uniref:Pentatricopeptide repeat-containing protein n=1 Tax=Coptis chinensis TaxID=261450 RepID=A0A835LCX3_9MAGN|nr:hypothetical protein IFM89_039609 [Coptis chinensis]
MTTLDHFRRALISFRLLNARGIKPTNFILCTLLNSCTQLLHLRFGLQIHARILQTAWYQHNVFINTALVNMYAKSNLILDAKSVFDAMEQHDHVSWTSIIVAYAQNGHAIQAFSLFKQMLLDTHIRPNSHTFATLITTASVLLVHSQLELPASLHAHVIKLGCHSNNCVVTSLIDSYSKCGEINLAVSLYRDTLHRDVILLNSMIAAYSQNQCGEQALTLFLEMQKQNISPTHYTFSTILNACATLALLPQGTQIHSFVTKLGSETSVFVASSLIDMYSKCGSIDEARRIFDQLDHRNNILWTSMITAYAQGGRGEDGLELFDKLVKEQGMRPDNICLTAVLTACNHAGLVG